MANTLTMSEKITKKIKKKVNKWLITLIIVLAVLLIVGIAYDQGLFDGLSGSGMGIFLAAIAAPYMALKNFLFGNKELKEFKRKYDELDNEEIQHRIDYDAKIKAKERRILELNREIELLDSRMELLELKKDKVQKDVNNMSVEQTKQEISDLFGD